MESPPTPVSPVQVLSPSRAARWRGRLRVGPATWARRAVILSLVAATLYLIDDRFGSWLRLKLDLLAKQRACMEVGDAPEPPTTLPTFDEALRSPTPAVGGGPADRAGRRRRALVAFDAAAAAVARHGTDRSIPPLPQPPPPSNPTAGFYTGYNSALRSATDDEMPVLFMGPRRAPGAGRVGDDRPTRPAASGPRNLARPLNCEGADP